MFPNLTLSVSSEHALHDVELSTVRQGWERLQRWLGLINEGNFMEKVTTHLCLEKKNILKVIGHKLKRKIKKKFKYCIL